MKALLLVITSIFLAPVVYSQHEISSSGVEKIKILSWNIYMLPGFLATGKVPRAEAIGQLLASSDYDVIVFQEAFHQKSRKTISRLLQPAFSFQAGPANQKLFSLKTNSGIWIFSKHPIIEAHSIIFNTRYGMDAFSRKGALLIELNINNNPVQVIGTHLQNAGSEWRRQSQCVELYHRLLKKYQRPGVPQIICGDFNITRYGPEENYQSMLQTLNADDGEMSGDESFSYDRTGNDMNSEPGSQKDLIDYILIRANEAWVQCPDRKIQIHKLRWNSSHENLSDHYAIETELYYQSNPRLYSVRRK
jgi:endonuclease/exonuclease/phosphatase family metal-dependent hydrolase